MSDRDMKALSNELALSNGKHMNVLFRDRMHGCNVCKSREHVKKKLPRVEQPTNATKVVSKDGVDTEECNNRFNSREESSTSCS